MWNINNDDDNDTWTYTTSTTAGFAWGDTNKVMAEEAGEALRKIIANYTLYSVRNKKEDSQSQIKQINIEEIIEF